MQPGQEFWPGSDHRHDRGFHAKRARAPVENQVHAITELIEHVLCARRAHVAERIRARRGDRYVRFQDQRLRDRMGWHPNRDGGKPSRFGSTTVSGPGQNASMSL